MNQLKFTFLLVLLLAIIQPNYLKAQWNETTNLAHKEAFLIKFKSVFKDIKQGESWQDYKTRLLNNAKVPGQLGPGSLGKDPFHVLDLRFLEEYYNLQGPNDLGIFYRIAFYPEALTVKGKKFSSLNQFDRERIFIGLNEFEKRRLQQESQEKLLDDLSKLKLPKSLHLTFSGMIMPYNFDKESFELRSNFFQFFGLKETHGQVKIPIPLNQDFRNQYPESYEMKMKPDEAEKLRNKIKPEMADSPEITSKLWLTIKDKLRSKPSYLDAGGSVFAVYHPNEYQLDSIEFFLTQNGKVLQKLFATDKLPQPPGTKKTSKNTNSSMSGTQSSRSTDYQLPFLRLNGDNPKQPFVQYQGKASNLSESLHEVGTIQLRLLYKHYQDASDNSLRPVPGQSMDVIGNIYFQLNNKGKKIAWQYVGRFEERKNGYRIYTGTDATAKFMKKFGYKDGYFDIIYNEDPNEHAITLLFFEGGKLLFSSVLDPLRKDIKPPFTN